MVTRKFLEKYLFPKLGSAKFTHQGLKYNCPKCDAGDKYNLEINMDRNIFNCWSCRYSGVIKKLLEEHAVDRSWENNSFFKSHKVHSEEEQKELNYPKEVIPFYLNREVKEYLINERGMDKSELIKRGVSYVYSENEVYHNHICFPFYEDGVMVGACLQNFSTKKYRNLGKLTFVPYKQYINQLYPITITEGCYDALSGINAIPLLRTEINNATLDFLRDKDVILALDNTVELELYTSQMKRLENAQVKSLVLFNMYVHKDMNEFFKKDKNGFFKEYKSCFEKIKQT